MGLFSFLRKNKQDAAPGKSEFRSQSDEPFSNTRNRPKRSKEGGRDTASDPILPEKKRARRRLIGAVVLVLAVIVVLPMILDPEPKPVADDIEIRIPSKDGKDANAAAASTAPADAGAPAAADEQAASKTAGNTPNNAANNAAGNSPDGNAVGKTVAETIAAEKPDDKQAGNAAANATGGQPEKAAEKPAQKPAAAIAAPPKAEKPAAHAAPKIAKAEPAVKPSEEERALAILQGKAISSDKAAANAAAGSSGKFVIQVAALATQEKVDELRNKLTAAGIQSYTQKVATKAGARTRIRVGPFASRDEADKARAKITKLGLSASVVPT